MQYSLKQESLCFNTRECQESYIMEKKYAVLFILMEGNFMEDEAKKVMERFMQKLKAGEFKKEIQPNTGHPMTEEYVKEQRAKFRKFLETDVVEDICQM